MKTELKIEKGVPIPIRIMPERSTIYPFRAMEVNDSFFVEGADQRTRERISARVTYENRKKYARFVTRFLSPDPIEDVDGTRVWRIE